MTAGVEARKEIGSPAVSKHPIAYNGDDFLIRLQFAHERLYKRDALQLRGVDLLPLLSWALRLLVLP
jgi:hypothetical protein